METLGMTTATPSSGMDQPLEEAVDAGLVRRLAQAHKDAGFDRVLMGCFSNAAEGVAVNSFVVVTTRHLGILLAYRPGVTVAPLAIRQLATLDQFSEDRLALNVASGDNDEDPARDGGYLDHDRRYARTDGYLQALRIIWTATKLMGLDGEFYHFQGIPPAARPRQSLHIPIYFSGSSSTAIEVATRHVDTYMLWGEPSAAVDGHIRRMCAAAETQGRDPRFSVLFRLIVIDTEGTAWKRTIEVLEQVRRNCARLGLPLRDRQPQSVGSQCLPATTEQGEVRDSRLRIGAARPTGTCWNSTALVGTLEQIVTAFGEYCWLGVSTFLIRDFDPFDDAVCYGRGLIPTIYDHTARLPLLRHAG